MDLAIKQNPQRNDGNLWVWPKAVWSKPGIVIRQAEHNRIIADSDCDYGTWASTTTNYTITTGAMQYGSFTDHSMTTCMVNGYSLGVMFNLSEGKYCLSGNILGEYPKYIRIVKFCKLPSGLYTFDPKYYQVELNTEDKQFSLVFVLNKDDKAYIKFCPPNLTTYDKYITITDMDLRKVD